MCLFWGVVPVFCPDSIDDTGLEVFINQWAKQHTELHSEDPFVVVTDTELMPGIHDSVLVAKIK
jgi:pyruvate kinase